ncbi:uncharacterized protein LOC118966143 [Oncorhynchus mykiss]|uniref:uncharacterized protein LOC118966143 n=1 Tax=Oncorhynchus mykiss TaxID=8022 RepID=UPI001877A0E8|nr:uncharacterized protein LOC118966143 [Oncorhynchus mykiss]
MATAGNRRSKEIGHDMSNELGNLKHDIKSFKERFEGKRPSLQERANYFEQKAADIKKVQDDAAKGRNVGAGMGVAGAVTSVVGIGLALHTGGLSLPIVGAILTTFGGATVVVSNVVKMLFENNGQEKIKNNAEEFNKSIQPIVECLEKIQTNIQTLEELSSSTSTVTTGLSTAAEVTRLLKKVAELSKHIRLGAVRLEGVLLDIVRLLNMIVAIIQVRRDEALEKEFFDKIIESAELCRKTMIDFETLTEEFNKVSDFLQHF